MSILRELEEMVAEANRRFDALSPEEKKAHRREQAIDWAWGELRFKYGDNPPISREQITAIYDEMHR